MPDIVLKFSGREYAVWRFHQMQKVRAGLEKQESQHLVIPRATLCEDFLIEERLPINTDDYFNMALYLKNLSLFDDPVREMTRLFSEFIIYDLFIPCILPIQNIQGIVGNSVKYDNLPLYLVDKEGKKEGKVGLIDLESIKISKDHNDFARGCETLARIFPYHLKIIIEQAGRLNRNIEVEKLQEASEKGKLYLKVVYSDHFAWLTQKGITPETNKANPFRVSPERANNLIVMIKNELLRFSGNATKDFLGSVPERTAKEIAIKICEMAIGNLNTLLNKQINLDQPSESEMLRSRSFKGYDITDGIFNIFYFNHYFGFLKDHFDYPEEYSNFSKTFTQEIVDVLMFELVRGSELFRYNLTQPYRYAWIQF